jgi:methionyl-tRNA formyltransferase
VPPLRALAAAGIDIALVVTNPDKRRGRGGALVPSPVKAAAVELGLPVAHTVDDALAVGADCGVVVAFGRLVKPHVLAALPMINLHFSLLPRWRGAAPVERALLAGDRTTGVCLMQLEEGLDTGPVYASVEVAIGPHATADELRAELVEVGTRLLVTRLRDGLGHAVAQQGEATYAAKLDPSELRLDWSRPAGELDRLVRLGGAWTTFRGRRLGIVTARPVAIGAAASAMAPGALDQLVVACGRDGLELVSVQPEGKRPMDAASWRHGARPAPGERLGG